jgi:hypothetical protein
MAESGHRTPKQLGVPQKGGQGKFPGREAHGAITAYPCAVAE